MNRLLTLLLPCLALALTSCDVLKSEKKAKHSITFHCQGSDMDSPRTIFRQRIPGKNYPVVFRLVPEFTHKNIAAFHSFPAPSGNLNGLTLKLDFRGANALDLITRTRGGEIMIAMVDGQATDYVNIDRPVSDGVITIWEGVSQEVIDELATKHPPMNRLQSMSTGQEMVPTTRGEKRQARDAAEKMRKDAEKADPSAKPSAAVPPPPAPLPPGPGVTLPQGQGTDRIPLEGGIQRPQPQLIKP